MIVIAILIQLLTGAVGGNVIGFLAKDMSLGPVKNSIAGIVGGIIGGQLFGLLGIAAAPSGALDFDSILGSVLSGVSGGGLVMLAAGAIKKLF